jgi:DNA-directed RNA polymerase sigma subunit (sigma70/sigma32)
MAKYDSLRKLKRNKTLLDYRKEHPDASLAEIGEVFGITKERVRQLLKTLNQTE